MKAVATKMKVMKRRAIKKSPAPVQIAAPETSAVWSMAAMVIMVSIFCGAALSALSFMSFVPVEAAQASLAAIYQTYSLPSAAADRLVAGMRISDENLFGLLPVEGTDHFAGQVAGAAEEK